VENIFNRACCDKTRSQDGEILEQISQSGSGGPIPVNLPGQVGWRSEQPGLVEDVPAHCMVAWLDDL